MQIHSAATIHQLWAPHMEKAVLLRALEAFNPISRALLIPSLPFYLILIAAFQSIYSILVFLWQIDGFVKIFPGVEHGWTTRYDANDQAVMKLAKEAHKDMIDWFVKYLKYKFLVI